MSGDIPTPSNLDVEQGLIGAVLIRNESFLKVASTRLEAEHFAEPAHQQIWKVMAAMIAKGHVASPITLKTYLGDEDFGGQTLVQYLARLCADATTLNAADYARTVRDLALRRRLIALADRTRAVALDAPVEATADTLLAEVERDLEALRPAITSEQDGFQHFDQISTSEVYDAYQRQAGVVGLSTGLSNLDRLLNGLQNSDLIILAGRPAMGKSALVSNIAVHVARDAKAKAAAGQPIGAVGFMSLEMSAGQLKHRIISDMASVSAQKLLTGSTTREEMESFMAAERELKGLPLHIDQSGGLSIAQVKMRARLMKKRHGLCLLVIDYLQLLSGTERKGRDHNRTQEVTEITSGLKALAKELEIPIIALSQLSRNVEDREDKRPQLRDLRESGSIEQDADSVLFVYREEYYLQKSKPREDGDALGAWWNQMRKYQGVAEVIVGKNRHGREGTVELGFQGEFTRFTNEPEHRPADPEEARETAKRIVLTSHGKALKEILHDLAVNIGRRPNAEDRAHKPKLPAGALLIDREEVKKVFREKVVVDLDDKEFRSRIQAASDNLRNAKLTENYTDPSGANFVYLPELIAE